MYLPSPLPDLSHPPPEVSRLGHLILLRGTEIEPEILIELTGSSSCHEDRELKQLTEPFQVREKERGTETETETGREERDITCYKEKENLMKELAPLAGELMLEHRMLSTHQEKHWFRDH